MKAVVSEVVFRERILCKHLFAFCTHYSKTVRTKATLVVSIALTLFPVYRERERSVLFLCLSLTHGYGLSCSSHLLMPFGGGDTERAVSVFIRQGQRSLFMCIFKVRRSLSFVGAWIASIGLSCYA